MHVSVAFNLISVSATEINSKLSSRDKKVNYCFT
jgi:hypothetical protein